MRKLVRGERSGERKIFSPFWGFRSDGVCSVFGHNYWRIPESPNGICIVCGRVAQDVLYKVKRITEHKQFRKEWESEPRICAICDHNVQWSHHAPSRKTFDGKIVCCYEHKMQHERNWMLSINPNNGGTKERLPFYCTWGIVQGRILTRDNLTCQYCGKTRDELRDEARRKYGHLSDRSDLEVHHITFRRDGGSDHPANLITLCHRCHARITARGIRSQAYDKKFKNMTKLEDFAG